MKRGIVAVILISVFLVVGCQQQKEGNKAAGAFVGGDIGLQVAFADNEPPATVLDSNQQSFFITLLLKNQGEFTIPKGGLVASLSGISKDAFTIGSLHQKNMIDILGTKKENTFVTPGAEEQLEFGEANYKIDIPADFQTVVRADVCYTYQTKAIANLCLKKNVLKKDINDVCEVNIQDLKAENSGAPIQIAQAHENSVGTSKLKLIFTVTNKGIGAVYEPGTFTDMCGGKDESKDKVKVTVFAAEGNFNVQCSQFSDGNSGVVRLVNKNKDVTCTIDTTNLQDITFAAPVIIQLDYMYREGVQVPLTVQNAV